MKITEQSVELIRVDELPTQLIERIGRTCYKSEDRITEDSAGKFVEMLADRGHFAMIEHAHASFRIVTDRGVTHELVRHRLASYAQESTRYCNYAKDKFGQEITVIQPPGLGPVGEMHWRSACEAAERAYIGMLDTGSPPQIARSVLPNSLKAEICITANFREYATIFGLRLAPAAHPQMRVVARMMWQHLVAACPAVFERFSVLAEKVKTDGLVR